MAMDRFTAIVGVQLDMKSLARLKNQIGQAKPGNIKVGVDGTAANNTINSIKNNINSIGKGGLNGVSAGLRNVATSARVADTAINSLERVNFSHSNAQINALRAGLRSLGLDSSVDKITSDIKEMGVEVTKVTAKMKGKNRIDVTVSGVNSLGNAVTKTTTLEAATGKLAGKIKQADASMKGMTSTIVLYDAKMQKAAASQNQLLMNGRKALDSSIQVWLRNNSAATVQFGAKLDQLRAKLRTCDATELKNLRSEFAEVRRQAQLAGVAGQTFTNRLKTQLTRFGAYFSVATVFMQITMGLRKMYQAVLDVDKAMTELYRVTDLTSSEYESLYDDMIASAKEYGSALSDIIEGTASWARLGFDANTAKELSEITTMYQHVSDLDVETATENLVTAYNGFKDELLNLYSGDEAAAVEYVADIFNELGNNYAISAEQVGAALTRCASALDIGGNSIQESAAMVTGITEVTQDAEKSGSAMKILSLRLRGMKGQLQELGEETDENVESISKMQTQILNMTRGKVNIFDENGEFKSTYEIMDGIAEIYDSLSSIEQADLLETIAGKHRANDVAALISNWERVEAAMTSATEAEGSASIENAKYMESIQGHLDKLKASWQAFSNTFMESDFLKSVIKSLTQLLDVLSKFVDTFGSLGAIGLGVGIFGLLRNGKFIASSMSTFAAATAGATSSLGNFTSAIGLAGSGLKNFMKTPLGAATVIGLVTAAIGLAVSAFQNWKQEQEEARQETIRTSNAFLDSANSFEQAYIKYSGRTNLTEEEESELETAIQGTVDALDDKSSALQDVVNSSSDYLESLDAIAKAELEQAATSAEAKKQAAKTSLEEAALGYTNLDGSEVNVEFNTDSADEASNEAKKIANEVGAEYIKLLDSTGKEGQNVINGFKLSEYASIDEIVDYYYMLKQYQEELLDADLGDTVEYANVTAAIDKMSEAVDSYVDSVYDAAKAEYQLENGIPKNIEDYFKMRESILSDMEGSIGTKQIVASTMDAEYGASFDLTSAEAQSRKFIGIVEGFNEGHAAQFETLINMKTAVNDGDCTVGEYMSVFNDIAGADGVISQFDEEAQKEISLSFGLDTDTINQQYTDLIEDLSELGLGEAAHGFVDNLDGSEFSVAVNLINQDDENFKNLIQGYEDVIGNASRLHIDTSNIGSLNKELAQYEEVMASAAEWGTDFTKTVYGNIDTNNRDVLHWTEQTLEQNRAALESWNKDVIASGEKTWDDIASEMEGSVSTVMGAWDSFEIGGDSIDIAFSPMLQTLSGAKVLSPETCDTYINQVISKAMEDGEWSNEELLAIDAEGIEVNGEKISGILADIGESAEATSHQMHYVGENGAKAMAEAELAVAEAENAINSELERQADIRKALNYDFNVPIAIDEIEKLNEILGESSSAMGLTSESITVLRNRYKSLDSYDAGKLFEKTANGIKVNREELAKLEKEYSNLNQDEIEDHLKTLVDEYNRLGEEIDKTSNASERARLISERESYADRIEELATMAAQYDAATGAYQRWLDAQEAPEDYEGYEAIAKGREDVEGEISRGLMGNASKEYIDLLSAQDLVGATVDEYYAAFKKLDDAVSSTGYSVNDFFTLNDDGDITDTGVDRFFDSMRADFEDSVAKFNDETGKWQYDFSKENLEKIQEEYGMGIESIQLLLEAAKAAGYDVDWGGILDDLDLNTTDFETLVELAENAQSELNKLEGYENLEFNFSAKSIEEATVEIEKAQNAYNEIIDVDGEMNLNAEGAKDAAVALSVLLIQKQQLEDSNIAINIDTSQLDESQADIAKTIEAVQNFREKYKNFEIAVATGDGIEEAKEELSTALTDLQGLGDEGIDIAAKLMLGEGSDGDALKSQLDGIISEVNGDSIKIGVSLDETSVGNLNSQLTTNFTPEATVRITGIDDTLVSGYTSTDKTANGTVTWNNDDSLVVQFQNANHTASGTVKWDDDDSRLRLSGWTATGTVTWTSGNNVKVNVVQQADGTAHAQGTAFAGGTAGRAFKHGDWGIKGSGVALGGELGQELVVRDGKFFTIGDRGAEFFNYKSGDIIFNAGQTKQLFEQGKIVNGKARGRAIASGTAFANGTIPSSGRAFVEQDEDDYDYHWTAASSESNFSNSVNAGGASRPHSSATSPSSSSSKSSSKSSSSKKDKEFKEKIDWIEVAIDRIERAIDRLDLKASSIFKKWSTRNSALASEIGKVREEIELQERGAARYLKEAESVGLSSKYVKKVQDGTIDIEKITNEELREKIDEYQQWYEKFLDCKEAAEELRETLSELYAQKFDNIVTEFEGIISVAEHEKNMLEEAISQSEAKGRITSTTYYDALIAYEKENQDKLIAQREEMRKQLNENVASGAIKVNSEEWVREVTEINDVTLAIEESNTALLDYAKTIRELEWEQFDALQERISHITEETEFLIELMGNDKLYNDNGQFTNEGMSTMGLHGVNYNTYMHQADMYGAAAQEAYTAWQKDPANKELEDHYYEMLELQREHILLAESEKDAVRDMVEEGINIELDALQERIDSYNELLDAQKDAYDYQKKVAEQTKEIASLEKQMAAYAGDDSEETRAKIQELKISLEEAKTDLEETEYDKYISDQEKLLDELYTEYETILNERLDNVDMLMQSMIDATNINASTINDTLSGVAKGVGTEMSAIMSDIWGAEGKNNVADVITAYDDNFTKTMTTTLSAINGIRSYTEMLKSKADEEAAAKKKKAKESNAAKSKASSGSAGSSGSSSNKNNNKNNNNSKNNNDNNNKNTSGDGTPKVGDKVKFVSGQYYYDSYGKNPIGSQHHGKEVYITNINKNGSHPYHISTGKKLGSGDLGWLKLSQISGYAAGKKNFLSDETAWTQENGLEYIIRPSDGAILTPLAKGDSVLNAAASSNLWNMANSPAEFIRDSLGIGGVNAPYGSGAATSVEQNFEQIVFSMPNVKNYDEMLAQMKSDKNFQRLIDSMGVDQLAGKSSLRKGKSIR